MNLIVRLAAPKTEKSLWRRLLRILRRFGPVFRGGSNFFSGSYYLEAFGHSDTGCVRANNEDYFRIEPQLGLYTVADGMGGARGGAYASRLAVDTVTEQVVSATRRDTQVLVAAMEEANRRVVEIAQKTPQLEGMGTTLLAGLFQGDEVYITSVGDSRVYLLDERGLWPVTQDQSWREEVGRRLGLDEVTLRRHPMRNVLTMAIGHGDPLEVKSYVVQLGPSAMVLMCTDGLHGVVSHADIEDILRDPTDDRLETKCYRLVEAARQAGGPDNIAVVLVRPTGKAGKRAWLNGLGWRWGARKPVCQSLFELQNFRGQMR